MHLQHTLVMLVLVLCLDGQVHTVEIIGGHEAVPHSRPYMVLLVRRFHSTIRHCDGFLLNEDFVITAAHCQASSYEALLGVHNFHKHGQQKISIEQEFPHKDFNKTGRMTNDIMLLKLSSKANVTDFVKPIGLAGPGDRILPQHCLVSGWGTSNSTTNKMTTNLMEVNVTLVDETICNRDHLYCSEGDTGPAPGDSGGPLVCGDGKAYGVVSFTYKPHPPSNRKPIHGFTKITDYKAWIDWTIAFKGKINHK
ncbi:granzyme B(G,H) [Centroberyx gerrardi]|uniref:granzyme B(G,H) n=1 Tax=Centroberyx gerrardi TaxID=166262 RepID=UPI003AAEDB05